MLAQNDPFLRRLYSFVSNVLDDHPYPSTKEEYNRRIYEIQRNVENLNLPPEQYQFLQRLMEETGVNLVDLWQGSHIITLDNGYLYDLWSQSSKAKPRISSHYKQVRLQQYGFDFLDHQLLFGKTALDGSTWFQMEAHGFQKRDVYQDPDLVVYHGQDFLKYRIHNLNVGPFGFSPHTETSNPIIRPYRPIQTQKRYRQTRNDQLFRRYFKHRHW